MLEENQVLEDAGDKTPSEEAVIEEVIEESIEEVKEKKVKKTKKVK